MYTHCKIKLIILSRSFGTSALQLYNYISILSSFSPLPHLQSPEENSALLCPIEEVRLNYSIVELEVEVNSSLVVFPADVRDYIITPLMPGTSYTVTVWFINEVGESLDNPTGKQSDKLTFGGHFTMGENLILASR